MSGAVDNGDEPVKIGGVYTATPPTFTDGQRGVAQVDARGNLKVALSAGGGATSLGIDATSLDAASNNVGLRANSFGYFFNGATWDRARTPNIYKPLASTAIGSEATIWTPTAGKKFRLMGLIVSASAAVSIVLKDNTAGATILQIPKVLVDTPLVIPLNGNGILSAAINNVLTATGSGAANLIGTIYGTEE